MDLLIIIIVTIVTIPVAELTEGLPRIILGILFLLVFPGYSLMAALFPGKDSLELVERVALSLVLSFAIVALTGLMLNYTPWGIKLTSIVVALAVIIIAAAAIALQRRAMLPEDEQFKSHIAINIKRPEWGNTSTLDKALSVGLVAAIIAAIATLVYVIAEPKENEAFTDFYLLGPDGMMENYPQELMLGEQAEVLLGIKNHEDLDTNYSVTVTFDGEEVQEIGPIILADNEEWRDEIGLNAIKAGEDQRVEFLLYKGEEIEPSLTLHLWLDVKGE